jgi:hypothetical protein
MREPANSTPADDSLPALDGEIVSIFVAYDHPLLQLKRTLDWDKIQEVMLHHWRAAGKNVDGGPGRAWPVSLYVPLLVLMAVKALNSRQVEAYISSDVVARVFIDLQDQHLPQVRDHSNIARAQEALGITGWPQLNELIVREAVRLGFGQPEVLSADTTVQEPQIGYPHEAGILHGIAKRCQRALNKLASSGAQVVKAAKECVQQVLKRVKHYHLFAKTKEQKDRVLREMVWQSVDLSYAVEGVIKQVGQTSRRGIQSAVVKLQRMVEVSEQLIPQIAQWVTTGVVAKGKILHAGITAARAIVKEKRGKKVAFGMTWLINRVKGGYVFGEMVEAYADEKKMPLESLKQYREVFGTEATPKMIVYDRGGSSGKTIEKLKKAGVEKIGVQPAGKAEWLVGEQDQQEVKSERGRTEGSIGALKSKRYCFNKGREHSNEGVRAAGQRAMVSMNLTKLMRDVVGKEKKVAKAAA